MTSLSYVMTTSMKQRGKVKRMGRGHAKRPNWKKAIVTLAEGDDIQFFDESEAEAAESKSEE